MATYDIATRDAVNVADTQATLSGEVTALDKARIDAVCAFFEYGTNSDLSDATRTSGEYDVALFADGGDVYTINVTGLNSDTTYYYKAKGRMIRYDDKDSADYFRSSLGFMDDLVNNSTELDRFLDDPIGRRRLLLSGKILDTLWYYNTPSEAYFNKGDFTTDGSNDTAWWDLEKNWENASTLEIKLNYYDQQSYDQNEIYIELIDPDDSSVVTTLIEKYLVSSSDGWITETADVSGYSKNYIFRIRVIAYSNWNKTIDSNTSPSGGSAMHLYGTYSGGDYYIKIADVRLS